MSVGKFWKAVRSMKISSSHVISRSADCTHGVGGFGPNLELERVVRYIEQKKETVE